MTIARRNERRPEHPEERDALHDETACYPPLQTLVMVSRPRWAGPRETATAKAGFGASTGGRLDVDPRTPSQEQTPRGRRRLASIERAAGPQTLLRLQPADTRGVARAGVGCALYVPPGRAREIDATSDYADDVLLWPEHRAELMS